MKVRKKFTIVNMRSVIPYTDSINKLPSIDAEVLATAVVESPPTAEVLNATNPLNIPSPFQLGFEPSENFEVKDEGGTGKTA